MVLGAVRQATAAAENEERVVAGGAGFPGRNGRELRAHVNLIPQIGLCVVPEVLFSVVV
jgi:hypothetical protein